MAILSMFQVLADIALADQEERNNTQERAIQDSSSQTSSKPEDTPLFAVVNEFPLKLDEEPLSKERLDSFTADILGG